MLYSELYKNFIETECSRAANSGVTLYRGSNTAPSDEFIGTVRQDRKPVSSSKADVRVFDALCAIKGYPHRKANTLSTSVLRHQARGFGNKIFEVIPDNSSTYLYSTKFDDLLAVSSSILGVVFESILNLVDIQKDYMQAYKYVDNLPEEELQEIIKQHIELIDSKTNLVFTTDLSTVPTKVGEVLIHGNKYFARSISRYET